MTTASVEHEQVKANIAAVVQRLHPLLIDISHSLHENPELLFQETQSATLLADTLEAAGFTVERGVAGLDTAFVATFGSGSPAIAFLAEYDALPKLGHACGHNIIATWAIGAGLALREVLPDVNGTIKVIGTPAEEGGGGKVIMADAGIFRGLDAAMMIHPRDTTFLDRASLGVTPFHVEFFGKSAHASAFPERGINALDAVLQVFFSVNALRQALKTHSRIHGVITHGGEAANVIPDYTAAKFLVRAKEQSYLEELEERFLKIVEAAALATGARAEVSRGISYQPRVANDGILEALAENMAALGVTYEIPLPDAGVGSSDIGNVSQLVPTIHPNLKTCETGIIGHTPEFAQAAAGPLADEALVTGATLLAWTGADLLLRSEVRDRVHATFRKQLGRDPQA